MFCQKCGTKLEDNSKFCGNCGASITGGAQPSYTPNLVGFSERIHDPIFEQKRKAGFRKSMIMGLIWFPVVVLLFQIVPFFADDFTRPIALIVGCIVGGFGLFATLIGGAKRSGAKSWDGEVIDKKITRHTTENHNGFEEAHYTHIIKFRLASGGKKKMKKKSRSGAADAWDMMVYLNIGDRVRYHGKLDYFEKYDKSRDADVPCANCRKYINIRLDACPNCHVPAIKP